MKPSNISALWFNFFGGNAEGCTFSVHPKSLQETANMIREAKDFLSDSGSKFAAMTMVSTSGKKEIVNLYLEQDKAESGNADFVDTVILDTANKTLELELDPYSWSKHN